MTPERIAQLYEVFKDDMPGNLRELQKEVDHWKAIWEMVNVAEKQDTLDDSRNQPRPIPQHVHCAMLRLKNYLHSTMTTERMSGLALMHVHKDTWLAT